MFAQKPRKTAVKTAKKAKHKKRAPKSSQACKKQAQKKGAEHKQYAHHVDLGLSVLCNVAERGDTLNCAEIAEVCGCSQALISDIARKAIKKLQGDAGQILRDFYYE